MAVPISDDASERIHRLEAKVADLEKQLAAATKGDGKGPGSMRMVIMGPPGAGSAFLIRLRARECGF